MSDEALAIRVARYRLYPTDEQEKAIAHCAGATRFVYNLCLEQRRDWHRQYKTATGKNIGYVGQAAELKTLRAEVDWISAVPRCALEQAMRDLDAAYERFFSGKSGYPTPRRKGVNDNFRIPGKEIHSPIRASSQARFAEIKLPKIGWCRFRLSRPMPDGYDLGQISVVREPIGWHICITLKFAAPKPLGLTGKVGIDRGVVRTLALSDGTFASQPIAAMNVLDRRAKRHQRKMSRQTRGSNRRAATRRLLANARAKIARIRKHWNHDQSSRLARTYGTVILEALPTSAMTRSAKGSVETPGVNVRQKAGLNRSILSQGWHQFEGMLSYKLRAAGGTLILVDPAYTSQACSACGSISKAHRKSQAVFECTDCGHSANADTNAALNILRAGEQPASRGVVRPSVKREPTAGNAA